MNQNRHFKISNFYIAAFLFSRGMELANIDKTSNPKRAHFVFVDSSERESLLNSFNYSKENSEEIMVDARKFITAIKALKEKLYQDNF